MAVPASLREVRQPGLQMPGERGAASTKACLGTGRGPGVARTGWLGESRVQEVREVTGGSTVPPRVFITREAQ